MIVTQITNASTLLPPRNRINLTSLCTGLVSYVRLQHADGSPVAYRLFICGNNMEIESDESGCIDFGKCKQDSALYRSWWARAGINPIDYHTCPQEDRDNALDFFRYNIIEARLDNNILYGDSITYYFGQTPALENFTGEVRSIGQYNPSRICTVYARPEGNIRRIMITGCSARFHVMVDGVLWEIHSYSSVYIVTRPRVFLPYVTLVFEEDIPPLCSIVIVKRQ